MYLVSMDVDPENLMDSPQLPSHAMGPFHSVGPVSLAGQANRVASAVAAEAISHIGPLNEGLNAICVPSAYNTSKMMRRLVSGLYGPLASQVGQTALPMRQITWSDASGLFRRFHYANSLHGEREYRVEHRPLWSDALSWRSLAANEGVAAPQMDRHFYDAVYALSKDQCVAPQALWNAARQQGLLQAPVPTYVPAVPTVELEDLQRRRSALANEIEYFDRLPIHDRTYSTRDELRGEQRRVLQDIDLVQRDVPTEAELQEQRKYYSQREQWQRDLADGLNRAEQLSGLVGRLRQEQQRLVEELHLASKNNKPAVVAETLVPVVTKSHMDRLKEIDTQLHHWQRTAAEIAAHRQQLEQSAAQLRVEKQSDLSNPFAAVDPREPLRALENQLLQTRRQLEDLVQVYNHGTRGNNYVDVSLPSTLKSMQENLYEVCRQISRKESDTASRQLHEQIEQLGRCEKELQTAIDKLLTDRLQLLQQIAAELGVSVEQLKLKLPYQCGCEKHGTTLHSYRVDQLPLEVKTVIRKSIDDGAEIAIREKLRETEAKLRAAQGDHAAILVEVRRLEDRLKDAPKVRAVDTTRLVLLREHLERVEQRLRQWDRMDDLRAEMRDLDRRIVDLRSLEYRQPVVTESGLHAAANSWHEKLTAVPGHAIQGRPLPVWANDQEWSSCYARPMMGNYVEATMPFENVAGRSLEEYRLATLAIRLAIVEAMVGRGHVAPLLVDDFWNELSVPAAKQVMGVLADVARRGTQVVMLTVDPRVSALARTHQAWVCHVRPLVEPAVQAVPISEPVFVSEPLKVQPAAKLVDAAEVNRRLHAIADELYSVQDPMVPKLRLAETPEPVVKKPKVKTYYVDGRGPFYLSRSSRIEEAPSMDDAMAARLRRVGVHTVGNLLDSSPEKVSLKLEETSDEDFYRQQGMRSGVSRDKSSRYVSPKRVARWQAESRLVCEVPNVRAFDSRVMVGCGIRTPRRLGKLTPRKLAKRVEQFLQTERGRQVLRSGNGYEVARITSWIVEANRDRSPSPTRDGKGREGLSARTKSDRRDRESARRQNAAAGRESDRSMSATERRLQQKMRKRLRAERPEREQLVVEPVVAEQPISVKRQKEVRRVVTSRPVTAATEAVTRQSTKVLKFFLSQDRPVVDAPSVGPKVAQRMNNCGIFTVRDFLQADPESLASRLGEARVSGDVIRQWQQQSQLVCRVPDLRGHDAQMLVAAGITSPERLAISIPAKLYEEIRVLAESGQGKRMLRGASAPDLDEVRLWVESAGLCRPLAAA